MNFKNFWLSLLLVAVTGCDQGSVEVNENIYIPRSSLDSRPFRLGSSAVQMIPVTDEAFQNGNDDFPIETVAAEVDIVTIVPEYLGIPYDIFAASPTPPESHPWTVKVKALVHKAQASGRPLMLQLGFVRESMVGRAWDNGDNLEVDLTWAPPCYDFAQSEADAIGDAYVNYAKWIAGQFQPAYVINFAEANIYYAECGPGISWDTLVTIQQRAYDAIKQVIPDSKVFAAFHVETLYEHKLDGWDETQYQALTQMEYDLFGMAAYPFGIRKENSQFANPYELPSDYLSRVMLRHPEEPRLAISETGWNNVGISVGDDVECVENIPYSDESFAAAYLEFLLNSAHTAQFDLVNWFSFRDTIPATVVNSCFIENDSGDPLNDACLGDFWCLAVNHAKENVPIPGAPRLFSEVVLKAFGAMGLREYDGTPRSMLMDRWRQELDLPFEEL